MTMNTEDLIASLAAGSGTPTQRLGPPSARLAVWIAVSLPWIALVVALMGLRPDLAEKLKDYSWISE